MKKPKTSKQPEPEPAKSPLTAYREKHGLSLAAMGELLNANASTIMRWERGSTPVPIDRLKEIEEKTKIRRTKLRPDIFGKAA